MWQQLDVPVLPHAFSPSQSFNDKRKRASSFHRKFPFYKNKEQSEQETSDPERKSRFSKENVTCNTRREKKSFTGNTHDVGCPCPRLGKRTRQAGRSGLTTVTSVCLQSGSFPWTELFFRQNALERDLRKPGTSQTAFIYCDQDCCLVHLFYHATLQGLDNFFFLVRNLRFHCHMYCFGERWLTGSDQIPLYWLPAFVHSFPHSELILG